jgi:carbon storage regulator
MLVLSRKEGEQIVIDQDIVVEVIQIRGHRARLGIEAPREKRILRKEIANRLLPPEPSHPSFDGPKNRRRHPPIGDGGRADFTIGR